MNDEEEMMLKGAGLVMLGFAILVGTLCYFTHEEKMAKIEADKYRQEIVLPKE